MNHLNKKISGIFIPVKDLEKSRNWYCDLLQLEPTDDFPGGHLYVLELDGINVVLDSKIYSENTIYQTAPFHFNTDNIENAYKSMKENGVEVTSEIEFGHFFHFKDPDGNQLMVCEIK